MSNEISQLLTLITTKIIWFGPIVGLVCLCVGLVFYIVQNLRGHNYVPNSYRCLSPEAAHLEATIIRL